MSKLSEIVGLPEEPRLEVREYRKTLDDWCREMHQAIGFEKKETNAYGMEVK